MTTNPTIFAGAISDGERYDDEVRRLVAAGADVDKTVFELTTGDVRAACDVLRAGLRGHRRGRRPGLDRGRPRPRVRHRRAPSPPPGSCGPRSTATTCSSRSRPPPRARPRSPTRSREGISVNVTLIFGLEPLPRRSWRPTSPGWSRRSTTARTSRGSTRSRRSSSPASTPRSTSGSRTIGTDEALALRGKAGVANARLAYRAYEQFFTGDRWQTPRRRRRQHPAPAVGVDRRQEPRLPRHDVRRRPRRRQHRQHDAGEDARGVRRPRRGRRRPGHHEVRRRRAGHGRPGGGRHRLRRRDRGPRAGGRRQVRRSRGTSCVDTVSDQMEAAKT